MVGVNTLVTSDWKVLRDDLQRPTLGNSLLLRLPRNFQGIILTKLTHVHDNCVGIYDGLLVIKCHLLLVIRRFV